MYVVPPERVARTRGQQDRVRVVLEIAEPVQKRKEIDAAAKAAEDATRMHKMAQTIKKYQVENVTQENIMPRVLFSEF